MKRLSLAAAALLLCSGQQASSGDTPQPRISATGTIPDRTIRVTDQTRYVNVARFETVRFIVIDAKGQEASFDSRFDQFDRRVFPLADIAPSGTLGNRSVQVYIQRDPPSD